MRRVVVLFLVLFASLIVFAGCSTVNSGLMSISTSAPISTGTLMPTSSPVPTATAVTSHTPISSATSMTSAMPSSTPTITSAPTSTPSTSTSLPTATPTPSIPTGVAISGITQTTANITWDVSIGSSSYTISYGTDSSATNLGTVVTADANYNLSGLTANTVYYVKVMAANTSGNSAYSLVGSFTTVDPSNWGALGAGLNGTVKALAYDSNHNAVYVGGQFTSIHGGSANTLNYIAKWNIGSNSWSTLGTTGLNSYVNALAYDSTNNILYAGGDFTSTYEVYNNKLNHIAKWDGSHWTAVGSGSNYSVNALVCDSSGNVYIGGQVGTLEGNPVYGVAKWNGVTWEPSTRLNGLVNAITYDTINNLLYVGGNFSCTVDDGETLNHIAIWNLTTKQWISLNCNWTTAYVYSFYFDSTTDSLYASGYFWNTLTGGFGLVRLNGGNWNTMGPNLNSYAYTIAVNPINRMLYVGGDFDSSYGGVPNTLNRVCKLGGSDWMPLGRGIIDYASTVNAMVFDSVGNLYSGGSFYWAGEGLSVNNIARWGR